MISWLRGQDVELIEMSSWKDFGKMDGVEEKTWSRY
jgi:hypothetical protein